MSSDMRNTGKIYYGWYILSGALLTQFIATSTGSMVSGVLLGPVVENLGLKVWQFAFAVSIAQAFGGVTVLIMGPVVDRVGPRRMMLIGSVFCTFGLTGLSMQSTFMQFFIFQIFLIQFCISFFDLGNSGIGYYCSCCNGYEEET